MEVETIKESIEILKSKDAHGLPSGHIGGYDKALDKSLEALDLAIEMLNTYQKFITLVDNDNGLCEECKLHILDLLVESGVIMQ